MSSTVVPRPVLLVGLLVCAAALAACGGSGSSSGRVGCGIGGRPERGRARARHPPPAGGDAVTIAELRVRARRRCRSRPGSTVTWTNDDSAAHTATADDGSFDSSSIAPGATFSQAFDTAGTFAYHCSIHPNMTATIEVN